MFRGSLCEHFCLRSGITLKETERIPNRQIQLCPGLPSNRPRATINAGTSTCKLHKRPNLIKVPRDLGRADASQHSTKKKTESRSTEDIVSWDSPSTSRPVYQRMDRLMDNPELGDVITSFTLADVRCLNSWVRRRGPNGTQPIPS